MTTSPENNANVEKALYLGAAVVLGIEGIKLLMQGAESVPWERLAEGIGLMIWATWGQSSRNITPQ